MKTLFGAVVLTLVLGFGFPELANFLPAGENGDMTNSVMGMVVLAPVALMIFHALFIRSKRA